MMADTLREQLALTLNSAIDYENMYAAEAERRAAANDKVNAARNEQKAVMQKAIAMMANDAIAILDNNNNDAQAVHQWAEAWTKVSTNTEVDHESIARRVKVRIARVLADISA